jgi:hypothetical protein
LRHTRALFQWRVEWAETESSRVMRSGRGCLDSLDRRACFVRFFGHSKAVGSRRVQRDL